MIVFDLKCTREHVFEAWFESGSAFESQRERKLVECPLCGCGEVTKAVMAPAVPQKGNRMTADGERKQWLKKLADVQAEVERSCDYVGSGFAKEARARHERKEIGQDERGIFGEATIADALELAQDGIAIQPLPFRPRQKANA